MNIEKTKIAIIGLGYVGLPLAVEFGKIRSVVGFDIDIDRISELRLGIDSTLEINQEVLAEAKNLEYSSEATKLRLCKTRK